MPRPFKILACAAVALIPLLSAVSAPAQTMAPPPPPAEAAVPPPPMSHHHWAWRPGYYRWDGRGYVWVAGHYVRAPYRQAVWVPGQWVFVNGRYVWHNGHWRR